jgi:antirestriction protein ArdC
LAADLARLHVSAIVALGSTPAALAAPNYLGSWLDLLKEDNRAIIRAASQVSKVAHYILGFLPADDGLVPAPTHGTGAAIEAA